MIRSISVAIAGALAFSAPSVQAASQASATISGLTFTLIDVQPSDGVAPSFNFVDGVGNTLFSVSGTDAALGQSSVQSPSHAGTFSFSGEYLANLSNAGAQASINGQSLSASGFASGPQTAFNASASTGGVLNPDYWNAALNLSLSPNSILLIEARVILTAAASNAQPCGYYCASTDEQASAKADFSLTYDTYSLQASTSSRVNKSFSLQATARSDYLYYDTILNPVTGEYDYKYFSFPGADESKKLEDYFSGAFLNTSSVVQRASLGLAVSVQGKANHGLVQVVPEPATYALYLLGLAFGAFVTVRGRQVQA